MTHKIGSPVNLLPSLILLRINLNGVGGLHWDVVKKQLNRIIDRMQEQNPQFNSY